MRADTQLIELDPFLFAQRLEYAAGGDLSLSVGPSRRAGLTLLGGYLQAGALAADSPAAVGVDTHEAHGGASYSFDLGPRDALTPEVRYAYTHYYHALLDTDLRRGPPTSTRSRSRRPRRARCPAASSAWRRAASPWARRCRSSPRASR